MKYYKILFLIVLSSVLVFSCRKDDKTQFQKREDKVESRTRSEIIGTYINGVPVLTVDEVNLVKSWNNFLHESGVEESVSSVGIELIDHKYYVVARGEGVNSVRALVADNDVDVVIDYKVTCTTTDCSSTPRCFPQGNTCVPCEKAENKCTKIISTGSI